MHRLLLHALLSIALVLGFATVSQGQRLTTTLIAEGLEDPVGAEAFPDGSGRILIWERAGVVKLLADGMILPTPFLDVSDKVIAQTDGGFLNVAFHPEFETNGWVYVYYTDLDDNAVVVRYEVSADNPDVADESTEFEIIKIIRDATDFLHAGGFMDFSPVDGYLYLSTGDAGPLGDPEENAQNPQVLLGKILRIDVDGGSPYAIPDDNPFVDDERVLDEIWAGGFRNPWRAAFDSATGDLYVGDVGNFTWEEVSFIAAGDGGGNYGWARKEGSSCFRPDTNCDPDGVLIDPIHEYRHSFFPQIRCAVTGGEVYRGSKMPLMRGTYFFGDYCSNETWSFRYEDGKVLEFRERTNELSPPGGQVQFSISSWGLDGDGELLLCDIALGRVYRIDAAMNLETTDLVAGERAGFAIRGARPQRPVFIAYSVTGIGETAVPPLNTSLALSKPVLVASLESDASGNAATQVTIPGSASGVEVWIQAIEFDNTSNVVNRVIR